MIERERDTEAALLEEQAARLAARKPHVLPETGRTVLVVRIDQELVAFAEEDVTEVRPLSGVLRLPGLPRWLPGVILHRGESICLVDLGLLLARGACEEPRSVVLVRNEVGALGIVAHELVGLRELTRRDLSDDLRPIGADQAFVELITRDLVHVIDVERLTRDRRTSVVLQRADEEG